MAGCAEMEAYRHTNDDDSETDSDGTEMVGAVLERGDAAESDDYNSHIVQPYRFEPYLAVPDGVDMARCGENVTCRQTNDDNYIAAASGGEGGGWRADGGERRWRGWGDVMEGMGWRGWGCGG